MRPELVQPHHHNKNHSNHEFTWKRKEESWPNSEFRRSRRLLWLFKWKESVVAINEFRQTRKFQLNNHMNHKNNHTNHCNHKGSCQAHMRFHMHESLKSKEDSWTNCGASNMGQIFSCDGNTDDTSCVFMNMWCTISYDENSKKSLATWNVVNKSLSLIPIQIDPTQKLAKTVEAQRMISTEIGLNTRSRAPLTVKVAERINYGGENGNSNGLEVS